MAGECFDELPKASGWASALREKLCPCARRADALPLTKFTAQFFKFLNRFYTIDAGEANHQQNIRHFKLPLTFWTDSRTMPARG